MLQHIHFTNQLADSEKNSSITSEIKKLDGLEKPRERIEEE
jgi:hypothetical protein